MKETDEGQSGGCAARLVGGGICCGKLLWGTFSIIGMAVAGAMSTAGFIEASRPGNSMFVVVRRSGQQEAIMECEVARDEKKSSPQSRGFVCSIEADV